MSAPEIRRTESPEPISQPPPLRLLDQVRMVVRALYDSLRTEDADVGWVRRFILFHGKRHPRDLGADEINQFLTDLAVQGHVAAATQNQARCALLFLYQQVLGMERETIGDEVVLAGFVNIPGWNGRSSTTARTCSA